MKYVLLALGLLVFTCGCGDSNSSRKSRRQSTRNSYSSYSRYSTPSSSEVARGMDRTLSDYGVPSYRVNSRAESLGSGRWAVSSDIRMYDGSTRTIHSTAVMDRNGDLHYYTE